jgi:hypothetical protein
VRLTWILARQDCCQIQCSRVMLTSVETGCFQPCQERFAQLRGALSFGRRYVSFHTYKIPVVC